MLFKCYLFFFFETLPALNVHNNRHFAIVPLFQDYIRICHIAVQPHSQAHKLTTDRLSQSADAGRQLSLKRQQPLILRYEVTESKKPKKWTCTCTPGDTASVHKENPWNFPFHASSHTLTHWVGLIDSWHSLFLHDTLETSVEIFLDWIFFEFTDGIAPAWMKAQLRLICDTFSTNGQTEGEVWSVFLSFLSWGFSFSDELITTVRGRPPTVWVCSRFLPGKSLWMLRVKRWGSVPRMQ